MVKIYHLDMIEVINNNKINMDVAQEQGNPTPPDVAVKELAKQLNKDHPETLKSAIGAIEKAALNSDDPKVRIAAIENLGGFLKEDPRLNSPRGSLEQFQSHARDKIAAIAFGSEQMEVRMAAVVGLGQSLEHMASSRERHVNTIQLIAIIGAMSPDNGVKNVAITYLSRYASSNIAWHDEGWDMSRVYKPSQNFANDAIGAIVSKPAGTE